MNFDDKALVIGLGAQKAGTSWLAAYLRSHPAVFIPRMKEMHWFDAVHRPNPYRRFGPAIFKRTQDLIAATTWTAKDRPEALREASERIERLLMENDADYMAFFRNRVTTEIAFGEFSPAYSVLGEDALRHMASVHPRVKFIFLMRNPVDRFWSAVRDRQKTIVGFNAITSFEVMLDDPAYAERSDYASCIARMEAALPASEVHYEFYEHLFSHDALDRLCAFLGIEPWGGDFGTRLNEGPAAQLNEDKRAFAVARLRSTYEAMAARFDLPASWRKDMARF